MLSFQQDVPFKPKEDFEIKLDLTFKQRKISTDEHTVHINETAEDNERRTNTDPLPYLTLRLKILKIQTEEVRLKVIKDDGVPIMNKKLAGNSEFNLEVGFMDDAKDHVSGYKHVIQFLSADKKQVSQIVIEFDKEGSYFVNGEKRGKL